MILTTNLRENLTLLLQGKELADAATRQTTTYLNVNALAFLVSVLQETLVMIAPTPDRTPWSINMALCKLSVSGP